MNAAAFSMAMAAVDVNKVTAAEAAAKLEAEKAAAKQAAKDAKAAAAASAPKKKIGPQSGRPNRLP